MLKSTQYVTAITLSFTFLCVTSSMLLPSVGVVSITFPKLLANQLLCLLNLLIKFYYWYKIVVFPAF